MLQRRRRRMKASSEQLLVSSKFINLMHKKARLITLPSLQRETQEVPILEETKAHEVQWLDTRGALYIQINTNTLSKITLKQEWQ